MICKLHLASVKNWENQNDPQLPLGASFGQKVDGSFSLSSFFICFPNRVIIFHERQCSAHFTNQSYEGGTVIITSQMRTPKFREIEKSGVTAGKRCAWDLA